MGELYSFCKGCGKAICSNDWYEFGKYVYCDKECLINYSYKLNNRINKLEEELDKIYKHLGLLDKGK